MKKQFLSFVMMLALVIVAGTAMAQTSKTPWEGTSYTYTVDGLTVGDAVSFVVTPIASINPTTGPISVGASAGLGVWYAPSATFAAITANTQAITITWGADAALNETLGDDYKLWVVVTDATTNCKNYRYLGIDPRSNSFDVQVYALGIANATGPTLTGNKDGLTACISQAELINQEYNVEMTEKDGQTYAYFRIDLFKPNPNTTYTWDFSVAFTGFAVKNTVEYSTNGTTWSAYTEGTVNTVAAGTYSVYARVLADAKSSDQAATATISNMKLGSFSSTLVPDMTSANNTKTFTISAIPTVGTFVGF